MHLRLVFRLNGVINTFISASVLVYVFASSLESHSMEIFSNLKQILLVSVPFVTSVALIFAGGGSLQKMTGRDAIFLVALSWVTMIVIGAVPYFLEEVSIVNALFESASGFSTTGATIITDFEKYSRSLMMWRSFTQWVGGMGIIVFFVSILPALGVAGKLLFRSEIPGPIKESFTPHVRDTTRILWIIYLVLTGLYVVITYLLGLSVYDAFAHAFTTISTGGFSPYAQSLVNFSPALQWVTVIFMVFAGTNFSIFAGLFYARRLEVFKDTEFLLYLCFLFILSTAISLGWFFTQPIPFERAFREGFFTVVSLTTTTGFAVVDYEFFPLPLQGLLFICFFCGGSASSTSGGIKFYRVVLFFKALSLEIKHSFFPELISSLRVNHKIVSKEIMERIYIFVSIYFTTVGFVCLILFADGNDFQTAFFAAATCVGNIGPGFGDIGPSENFAHFSALSKLVSSWAMVLGRLEFFTILTLLHPFFWRKNN